MGLRGTYADRRRRAVTTAVRNGGQHDGQQCWCRLHATPLRDRGGCRRTRRLTGCAPCRASPPPAVPPAGSHGVRHDIPPERRAARSRSATSRPRPVRWHRSARPTSFVLGALRDVLADGVDIGGTMYGVEIIDRDSESNSNTAATVAQELIAQRRRAADVRRPDARHHRAGRPGVHQQRDPRAVEQRAVAAALPRHRRRARDPTSSRRSPRSGTTTSSGGSRTSSQVLRRDVGAGRARCRRRRDVAGRPRRQRVGRLRTSASRRRSRPPGSRSSTRALPARHAATTPRRSRSSSDAGVEIVTGVLSAARLRHVLGPGPAAGLQPTAVTVGKGLLFPSAVASYPNPTGSRRRSGGPTATRRRRASPGRPSAELAAAFEEATGTQWTQPVGYVHSLFEVAIDVAAAGRRRRGQAGAARRRWARPTWTTLAGTVDFTNPVVPHVTKTPLVGGPVGAGREYDVEFNIVTNDQLPGDPPRRRAPADRLLTSRGPGRWLTRTDGDARARRRRSPCIDVASRSARAPIDDLVVRRPAGERRRHRRTERRRQDDAAQPRSPATSRPTAARIADQRPGRHRSCGRAALPRRDSPAPPRSRARSRA